MKYFLIAGERSGDEHGAMLVSAIKRHDDKATFSGYGGASMRAAGVHVLKEYWQFNAFGVLDVLKRIRFFRKFIQECVSQIKEIRSDFLILIDFPGFNLQVARHIKRNIKVVYFIPPKVWAWGSWRLNTLVRYTDQVHFIFPFESNVYHSLVQENRAWYIGNPTKWKIQSHQQDLAFINELKAKGKSIIAFLPGSRRSEVDLHLALLPELSRKFQDWLIVIPMVDNLAPSVYDRVGEIGNVKLVMGKTLEILAAAKVAVVASGTATLETALIGTPQLVIYKTNWITYLLARGLVMLPYISLVDILAGRRVVPELIQHHCTIDRIHSQIEALLDSKEEQKKISEGYSEISNLLGDSDPFERSARLILNLPKQP